MPKPEHFETGPYHVAKNGQREAWAYNTTPVSIDLFVRDANKQQTIRLKVRKETLRRLAALK